MNWKAIKGVLGGIVFIISVGGTIYQLINWDHEYWELVMNITFAIAGLSGFMNWIKNNGDGELMTDEEEKKVFNEWKNKKDELHDTKKQVEIW